MSINIQQIAELAGVSRGTVDRALHDRGGVNAETSARIRKIAEELGYKPNLAAKMLSEHRYGKQKIGIILATENNAIYDEILQGINSAMKEYEEYGIENTVSVQKDFIDAGHQVRIMEQMQQEGVGGIVMTPIQCDEVVDEINKLIQQGIQVVTINTDIQGTGRMTYVGCHHKRSGIVMAELLGLIADGHRMKVGIISGPTTNLAVMRREKGLLEELKSRYPNISVEALYENERNEQESYEITKRIMTENPQLDALCLLGSGMIGSLNAVSHMKRSSRLKVYTYDLIPEVRDAMREGIVDASITQEPYRQGYEGVQTIVKYLSSGRQMPEQDSIYTELAIVTKSCLTDANSMK